MSFLLVYSLSCGFLGSQVRGCFSGRLVIGIGLLMTLSLAHLQGTYVGLVIDYSLVATPLTFMIMVAVGEHLSIKRKYNYPSLTYLQAN
jgi:hypothetical protein